MRRVGFSDTRAYFCMSFLIESGERVGKIDFSSINGHCRAIGEKFDKGMPLFCGDLGTTGTAS